LSGVDVKAAIRRARLSFVASLFLVALLGTPITTPAGEPVPAPAAAARSAAAQSAVSSAADSTAPEQPAATSALLPVLAAPAVVRPVARTLRDQAARPALAPRAPPLA
jgi:hypothetical protein